MKKRKSKGFMLYKKNGSKTIKMSIGHSFDSITELLKKKRKEEAERKEQEIQICLLPLLFHSEQPSFREG